MNYFYENGELVKMEASDTNKFFENGILTEVNPAKIENDNEVRLKVTMMESIPIFKESYFKECFQMENVRENKIEFIKSIAKLSGEAKTKGEQLKFSAIAHTMHGDLLNYKRDLVKRTAFTIFDESFDYPAIYEVLIDKVEQLEKVIDANIKVIDYENTVCPTGLNDNSTNEEDIDGILKDMFKGGINAEQLGLLKNNLRGESKYVRLVYIGTKANLWKDTVNLRQANIERKDIARVFSECVKWKKSHSSSINEDLKYDELYSKILNKK